jgi:hypothetical protein
MATSKRAVALYSTIGVVAAAGAMITLAKAWWPFLPQQQSQQTPAVAPAQLRLFVARLGLSPDAMAAAGVTPAQATAVGSQLRSRYADLAPPLDSAQSALRTAITQREQLRRKIAAGRGAPEDTAALSAATAQATAAASARASARDAALADLGAAIGTDAMQKLKNIRESRKWPVPVYFRVVTRTAQEWSGLETLLSSRDVAARLGRPVPDQVQAVITTAESDPAVAAAKASFEANRAAVAAAFVAALGN